MATYGMMEPVCMHGAGAPGDGDASGETEAKLEAGDHRSHQKLTGNQKSHTIMIHALGLLDTGYWITFFPLPLRVQYQQNQQQQQHQHQHQHQQQCRRIHILENSSNNALLGIGLQTRIATVHSINNNNIDKWPRTFVEETFITAVAAPTSIPLPDQFLLSCHGQSSSSHHHCPIITCPFTRNGKVLNIGPTLSNGIIQCTWTRT
jgi:hypothetical protein